MSPRLVFLLLVDGVVTASILGWLLFWWQSGESTAPTSKTLVAYQVDSPERLAVEFAQAFKAQDVEALNRLFCWDGVDAATRAVVEESVGKDLQYELMSVDAEPLEPGELLEYELQGTLYRPNLPVSGRLKVCYRAGGAEDTSWTAYLIGVHADRYWISLAAPVK